jgi:hypothetical protein
MVCARADGDLWWSAGRVAVAAAASVTGAIDIVRLGLRDVDQRDDSGGRNDCVALF